MEEENIETNQIFLQDAMTGHYLDTYKKMKYMFYQVTLNSLPKHGRIFKCWKTSQCVLVTIVLVSWTSINGSMIIYVKYYILCIQKHVIIE